MDQYYPSSLVNPVCGKGKLKVINNYNDSGSNIWVWRSISSPHDKHSNMFSYPRDDAQFTHFGSQGEKVYKSQG